MFLRHKIRNKDGKRHRYWSVVENKRVAGGGVVQKHVLHLGEINDSQELAWRRSIEVLDEAADRPKTLSLFPEDRCEGLAARRLDRSAEALAASPVSAAAMGRLLAGAEPVGGVAARSVLGRAAADEPQGHALGSGAVRAGRLSAAGAGQRVAAASGMVRTHRARRSLGRRLRTWPRSTSFIAATIICWSTNKRCSII